MANTLTGRVGGTSDSLEGFLEAVSPSLKDGRAAESKVGKDVVGTSTAGMRKASGDVWEGLQVGRGGRGGCPGLGVWIRRSLCIPSASFAASPPWLISAKKSVSRKEMVASNRSLGEPSLFKKKKSSHDVSWLT